MKLYTKLLTDQGIAVTVDATGHIKFATLPAVTQTIDRYVDLADGTSGTEETFTYTISAVVSGPTITSVNATNRVYDGLTNVDIIGENFGATEGFVAISGNQQVINSWSDTLVNIDVDTALIGTGIDLTLTKGE